MRVSTLAGAMAAVGEVDVFAWVDPARLDEGEQDWPVTRLWRAGRAPVGGSVVARMRWFSTDRRPLRVALRPVGEARRALVAFRRHTYDATVVVGVEAAAAFGDLLTGPVVLDLIDLEDAKVRSRAAADAESGVQTGVRGRIRAAVAHRDESAWSRLQARLAAEAAVVTVCSSLDAERLGAPRAVVVPNGYTRPGQPAGDRQRIAGPPTVTFVGSLTYPPNVDAARFLVGEVLPCLRRLLPQVRVRLVGRAGSEVEALARVPGVTVCGFVERIADELGLADVALVPLRHGGGTRIKVLEAFAHRVPVVSTPLGAEGIAAEHGRHLLLASTADELAAGCIRVISDPELRSRLVAEAHRLYLDTYQWAAIGRQFESVLLSAAGAVGRL